MLRVFKLSNCLLSAAADDARPSSSCPCPCPSPCPLSSCPSSLANSSSSALYSPKLHTPHSTRCLHSTIFLRWPTSLLTHFTSSLSFHHPPLAGLGQPGPVYLYLDRHSALCLLNLTCYAVSVEKTSISSCQFVCQLQLTVLHNVVVVVVAVVVVVVVSLSSYVLLLPLPLPLQTCDFCRAQPQPLLQLQIQIHLPHSVTDTCLDGHLNNAQTATAAT